MLILSKTYLCKTIPECAFGSVSKILTAMASLRMADTGLLDTHSNINQYYPQFPDKKWPITSVQLASHSAGIRHYNFANYVEANNVRFYSSLEEALAVFSQEPLLFEPGSEFEYTSLGYNLLGVVLEKASQLPFANVMAKYVTTPLKMKNTLPDHPLNLVTNRTRFYTVSEFHGGVINTLWRDSSDYYPSGGMLSTAEDLVTLTNEIFNGNFLSPQSLALLKQEQKTRQGEPTGYGYGWQIVQHQGEVNYQHGGETNGAYAHVSYFPEHKLSIAGIANYNFWGKGLGEARFFNLVKTELPVLFKGK